MKSRVIVTMAKTSARVRIAIHPIGTLTRAAPSADHRKKVEGQVSVADTVLEHDGNGIGTHPEECGVPQGRIAGVAAEQVPGARQAGIHQREDQHIQDPRRPDGQRQKASAPKKMPARSNPASAHIAPRMRTPKSPVGRSSSTRSSTTKKVKSDQMGESKGGDDRRADAHRPAPR